VHVACERLCRRRQRKIRSRSHYTLHDAELTGSTQTFDGGARDLKQAASAGIYSTGRARGATPPAIYKSSSSSCAGTWQRTRPLPVPRLPSANEEDEGRGSRDDDDDVIALTPLTSACSEHLLASSSGADDGVLNVVGPAALPCCTAAGGDAADCVESRACRAPVCCPGGSGPVAHGRTRSTPQPIDAARLLLLNGDRAAVAGGGGGGYERCVADRARGGVPSSGGGGPYYFKLDLTSGLSAGDRARAGERPASPGCMMCAQQQQQQQLQQHATLPRRITTSPPPPLRGQRF